LKNILNINVLVLVLVAALLVGCNNNGIELKDGDKHITVEMDEVISNFIIQKYSSSYLDTEKQFEVHKVYGTSESDGVLSVYMWSYYGGFNKSTKTQNQAGHSLPAVIQLKKEKEHYSVVNYTEPQEGSFYQSSLKKMFPEKYVKFAQREAGNIKGLEKKMDEKVNQWLNE